MKVDITPFPRLMEDIGYTSFTVAEAVVELLANSFDARVGDERLDVEVFIDDDMLSVTDDGSGMERDVLANAVRLSVDMDSITGRKDPRKGMFGLGMKTAAASMGRHWAVHTRPVGGDVEYSIEFDLVSMSRSSTKGDWSATILEGEPDFEGPLGDREHGTAVVITKLRERDTFIGAVIELAGRAFRPHLDTGDVITVNGIDAIPPVFDLIEDFRMEVDERCMGHRITGWVGLDKKTHNDDFFGLNLYRKGQLISMWDKSWFRAHLMTSRIVGEVNLDFVPPNFHKKGFETQSAEWKAASEVMRKVMKTAVKASNEASKKKGDPQRDARAISILKGFTDDGSGKAVRSVPPAIGGEIKHKPMENPTTTRDDVTVTTGSDYQNEDSRPIEVSSKAIKVSDNETRIDYGLFDMGDVLVPWSYMNDDEDLLVIINKGSHLYNRVKDTETMALLGLADCMVQFLVEKKGVPFSRALSIRNSWLMDRV